MQSIYYITSLLTFWLKGEVHLDNNFVSLKNPNTILKIIPLGAKKDSVPVSQLASVESNFKLHLGTLIVGLIIAIIGWSSLSDSFLWAIILMLIGINGIISSFETVLIINTTAGDFKPISFLVFDKKKAEELETQIREIISNRLNDTNNRVQTDRIVDAINNK